MTKKEQFIQAVRKLRDCLNKFYELDKAWYDSYMLNIENYKTKYPKVFQSTTIDNMSDFYCNFISQIYRPYFLNRFKEWFNKSQYYKQFNLKYKDNHSDLRYLIAYNSDIPLRKLTIIEGNVYAFYFPYFLDLGEVEKIIDVYPYTQYFPTVELKKLTSSSMSKIASINSPSPLRLNAFTIGLFQLRNQWSARTVTQNILNQAEREIPLNIKAFCELIDSMHSDMLPLRQQIAETLRELDEAKNNLLSIYYEVETISSLDSGTFSNVTSISNSLFPANQNFRSYKEILAKVDLLLSWVHDINKVASLNQSRNHINIATFTKGRERSFNQLTDTDINNISEALKDKYIPSLEGFVEYAKAKYESFGNEPSYSHVSNRLSAVKEQISAFTIAEPQGQVVSDIEKFPSFKQGIINIVKALGCYNTASRRLIRSYLKPFKADIDQFYKFVIALLNRTSVFGRNIDLLNLLNLMVFNNGPSYLFSFKVSKIKDSLKQIVNSLDSSEISFTKLSLDLLKVLYIMELCYNYRMQIELNDEISF